jgi:hypothetical protein
MSPLNIHPEEAVNLPKKKKNKTLKVLLGIAALVAVPVVGSTLAASIGINTGNNIQFGQGVTQAVACDSAITVTAGSGFTNASTAGAFSLTTVTISDVDVACDGKTFTIRSYKDTDATPLTVGATTASTATPSTATLTAIKILFDAQSPYSTLAEPRMDYTLSNLSATAFTVTLVTKPAATDVYKFTVESA